MNRWTWVLRYAMACFLALVLAGILGGSQLFQHTTLGAGGPAASEVARFLGEGAALLLIWFGAARVAAALADDARWRSFLRRTIVPLATLVVLALGYGVPLLVLRPVLTEPALMAYRWLFVVAIVGAAFWVALAGYQNADALSPIVARLARRASRRHVIPLPATTALVPQRCSECGTIVSPDATFCQHCGHRRAA